MNILKNDLGQWVPAVGAPGSIERVKIEYPKLLSQLAGLPISDTTGALELIRQAGIKSTLEICSVFAAVGRTRFISDLELPGLWQAADLIGGETDK